MIATTWREERPTTTILSRTRRLGWRIFWLLVLLCVGAWICLRLLFWWVGTQVPDLRNLANYHPWRITQVYDAHGSVVMELADQRRRPVSIHEIPPLLRQAIVAAEDADFYRHEGLDYTGILRALWKNLWRRRGHPKQGGSTITQQVVKTFLLSPEQTYTRKLKEAVLAQKLEQHLKKDEILYLYLNQIYMGRGCYGIGEAARYYFNKPVSQLTLGESAILAGIPKNPSRYNPIHSAALTMRRRNYVLAQMHKHGYISYDTYMAEKSQRLAPMPAPAPLAFQHDDFTKAVTHQAWTILHNQLMQTYPNHPQQRTQETYKLLHQSGLHIETTLHPRAQRLAQQLLQQSLTALETRAGWKGSPVQGAWVALEPHTRRIVALLDGRSYQSHGPARSSQLRYEPGNMVSPFLFTAGLDSRKFTPASLLPCPSSIVRQGPPGSSSGSPNHHNPVPSALSPCSPFSLRNGFEKDHQATQSHILAHIGMSSFLHLAQGLGLEFPSPSSQSSDISVIHGKQPVSLLALTNAYASFVMQGAYDTPTLISRIQTHDNRTLFERMPDPQRKFAAGTAHLVLDMLQRSHKTEVPSSPSPLTIPIAGKFGMTPDRRNLWWVGCAPTLCTGIWLGFDDHAYIFPPQESATTTVLPLALDWFRQYLLDKDGSYSHTFFRSEDVISVSIDPQTGLRLSPHHPNARTELFLYGTQPDRSSPLEAP